MTLRPCLDCGDPTDSPRCREHQRPNKSKTKTAGRGYDNTWNRLSRKARQLQPWCLDCGATEDLQTDHSPEAWQRHARGLPIRLRDVDVVCGECNRTRGAARPANNKPDATPNDGTITAGQATHHQKRSDLHKLGGKPHRHPSMTPRPEAKFQLHTPRGYP